MKYIRMILGPIILFADWITRPKQKKRSVEEQNRINANTKSMSLYQFNACPFCVKVRRAIHRLNLNIQLIDATDEGNAQELINGGGKRKVPCLKIQSKGNTTWMYESKEIIKYLDANF